MQINTSYYLRYFGPLLAAFLLYLFATYTAADTVITNVTVTYVVTDPSGSPIVQTDANGNVISEVRYQPYGEPTQLVGSQPATGGDGPGFQGKIVDRTTGLSNFGARYYNPKSGRFMSVDPAMAPEGDPHRFNHYTFGNNNPYRYVDPDGRAPADNEPTEGGTGIKNWPEELGGDKAFASVMGVGEGDSLRGEPRALTQAESIEANEVLTAAENASEANKAGEQMEGRHLPDSAFNTKAPKQVTPGTKTTEGQHINDQGRVEPWKAAYDKYGRLKGRTDYNAGNKSKGIDDVHHHTYEYGPGNNGRESGSHISGEYKGGQ